MKTSRLLWIGGVVAWLAAAWASLLHGLNSFGLIGPDEPRYAEVAWEMLQRHDWVTPHLWGAVWFEKPVLYYWLAAIGDRLTGNAELGARLPNALLGLLVGAALFFWVRRSARQPENATSSAGFPCRQSKPRLQATNGSGQSQEWSIHRGDIAGALAAVIGCSAAGMIGFGRAASTDMTLTAPLAGALMAFQLWSETRRPGWRLAGAALLALATLAKGPVAVVLAGLIWLGYAAWRRQWRDLPGLLHPAALALYFAITAPWYVLVTRRNPEFFRAFFLQHNLERFATNLYQHPQPFWFFFLVLPAMLFPWTGWLALLRAPRGDRLKQYLWCWILAPLIFFTLSRSKLPGYILPALPAAAALLAVTVAERWRELPHWAWALVAAPAAVIPAGVWLLPWFLAARRDRPPLEPLLARPGVEIWLAVTLAALGVLVARRRGAALVFAITGLAAAGVFAATRPPISRVLDVYASARPISDVALRYQNLPLFGWKLDRNAQYGTQFYLHRELPEWHGSRAAAAVIVDGDQVAGFEALYGHPLREWELPGTSLLLVSPESQVGETDWSAAPRQSWLPARDRE